MVCPHIYVLIGIVYHLESSTWKLIMHKSKQYLNKMLYTTRETK